MVLFTNISSKSTCLFIEPQAGHLMFVQNEGFASRIVRLPLTQVWISWAKLFSIDCIVDSVMQPTRMDRVKTVRSCIPLNCDFQCKFMAF